MKIVWSLVALLLFGTFLVVLLRSPTHPRPLQGRPADRAAAAAQEEGAMPQSPGPEPASMPAEPTKQPAGSTPAAAVPVASAAQAASAAAGAESAEQAKHDALLKELKSIEIPGVERPVPAASPGAGGAGAVELPASEGFPPERLIRARVARNPDGTLRLDDRFTVAGKGTKDDPYRVPWDLLVSAQETYKPRMGQTRLPERVTFLHGRYVTLTGYVAFPITASTPKEMLSMLNQWDGCCIGVPPTAYDAVEVKLKEAASPQERFLTHGTVTGRFRVDPYEDGGWLLGLYLMEDAALVGGQ